MKALLITFSVLAGLSLTAGSALAQAPMVMPASGSMGGGMYGGQFVGGTGMGHGGHGHGLGFGLLSGLFSNHGHPWGKQRGGQGNVLPVATGGTLVFPQNPFVRSPRDYFMQ